VSGVTSPDGIILDADVSFLQRGVTDISQFPEGIGNCKGTTNPHNPQNFYARREKDLRINYIRLLEQSAGSPVALQAVTCTPMRFNRALKRAQRLSEK
jgi:hypothetical protein